MTCTEAEIRDASDSDDDSLKDVSTAARPKKPVVYESESESDEEEAPEASRRLWPRSSPPAAAQGPEASRQTTVEVAPDDPAALTGVREDAAQQEPEPGPRRWPPRPPPWQKEIPNDLSAVTNEPKEPPRTQSDGRKRRIERQREAQMEKLRALRRESEVAAGYIDDQPKATSTSGNLTSLAQQALRASKSNRNNGNEHAGHKRQNSQSRNSVLPPLRDNPPATRDADDERDCIASSRLARGDNRNVLNTDPRAQKKMRTALPTPRAFSPPRHESRWAHDGEEAMDWDDLSIIGQPDRDGEEPRDTFGERPNLAAGRARMNHAEEAAERQRMKDLFGYERPRLSPTLGEMENMRQQFLHATGQQAPLRPTSARPTSRPTQAPLDELDKYCANKDREARVGNLDTTRNLGPPSLHRPPTGRFEPMLHGFPPLPPSSAQNNMPGFGGSHHNTFNNPFGQGVNHPVVPDVNMMLGVRNHGMMNGRIIATTHDPVNRRLLEEKDPGSHGNGPYVKASLVRDAGIMLEGGGSFDMHEIIKIEAGTEDNGLTKIVLLVRGSEKRR